MFSDFSAELMRLKKLLRKANLSFSSPFSSWTENSGLQTPKHNHVYSNRNRRNLELLGFEIKPRGLGCTYPNKHYYNCLFVDSSRFVMFYLIHFRPQEMSLILLPFSSFFVLQN